ncbi:MAG: hypothetical protein RR835_02720 [Peptostreptococcaceae bacterium]
MLITFWSPYHGQSGTTSNAISMAVNMALNYDLKVLLTHSKYTKSNMEYAFDNENGSNSLKFDDTGIDSVSRLVKVNKLEKDDFKNYTKTLIHNRLELLSGSKKLYKESYEDIDINFINILKCAKKAYDAVIVDVNSGICDKCTNKVLNESDIVVININQNEILIKDLFSNEKWKSILEKKDKILLLGKYDKNSKCTYNYVERTYKYRDKIYTVPYSSDFMDACNNHNVIKFFKANVSNISNKENCSFMLELDKLSERLIDMMELEKEKDVIKNTTFTESIKGIFKRKGGYDKQWTSGI